MDWIKVKVKHAEYDFEGAPDSVFRAWINIMVFVAAIERKPLQEELHKRIGKDTLVELETWLQKTGTSISSVIGKVLEDVDFINKRKSHERKYMREYRSKVLHNRLRSGSVSGKEKRREEKNIEAPKVPYGTTDEKPKSIPRKAFKDLGRPDPKEQEAVAAAIARDKGKIGI